VVVSNIFKCSSLLREMIPNLTCAYFSGSGSVKNHQLEKDWRIEMEKKEIEPFPKQYVYGCFQKWGKPPKWMVYNGKPLLKWMIWGDHYFRKHPYIGRL